MCRRRVAHPSRRKRAPISHTPRFRIPARSMPAWWRLLGVRPRACVVCLAALLQLRRAIRTDVRPFLQGRSLRAQNSLRDAAAKHLGIRRGID